MSGEELFNCNENKVFSKILHFWEKHESEFPKYYQKYFKSNIFEMIEKNDDAKIDDITRTIFNYLGLLSMSADTESQFLSFFEQYFNYTELFNKKIVGVTHNFIPTLSVKISKEMERINSQGSLKVYGSNLINMDTYNFDIHKRMFDKNDFQNDDLIVSFAPREMSERIFLTALELNKELLLNFDGFVPERDAFFLPTKDSYLNELYYYGKDHKDPSLDIEIVNYSSYNDTNYSALVLKRK